MVRKKSSEEMKTTMDHHDDDDDDDARLDHPSRTVRVRFPATYVQHRVPVRCALTGEAFVLGADAEQ
jgi:hypothetical protein